MGLCYNYWYRSTAAGKLGLFLVPATFVVIAIAFGTPNWLEADYLVYAAKFDRLGLWMHCFRSLPDPNDLYQTRFYVGCRWVYNPFTKGYDEIRGFLMPPFFVAVQVFFTFCFTILLLALTMIISMILCCLPEKFILMLKIISATLLISAICGTIAVIVFGALGDSRDWMPNWQHNYLSWSFGLAVVGTFMEYVAAILFYVEFRTQIRRAYRQKNGTYGLEKI